MAKIPLTQARGSLGHAFQDSDQHNGKTDAFEVNWQDGVQHFTGGIGEQADDR